MTEVKVHQTGSLPPQNLLAGQSPKPLLWLSVLAIFVAEIMVMLLLQVLPPLTPGLEAVLDSTMLLLVLSPTIYYLHYRPLSLQLAASRQATERLVLSEERLRLAQAAVNDGLWDWDLNSGRIYYSPRFAAILGYRRDDLKPFEKRWPELLHPEDHDRVMGDFNAHLAGDIERFVSEHRMKTARGSWLWVLARGQVVSRDNKGRPGRMIGTLTDINERKAVEQQLLERERDIRQLHRRLISQAEEERRHLARDLHDEFGQALTAFKLGVEQLQQRQFGSEDDYQRLCRHLQRLANRLDADIRHITGHLRPVLLDDLGLVPALQALASELADGSSGVEIVFSPKDLPGRLVPDIEIASYRICQEALNNALKHARAGRVEIWLDCCSGWIEVQVRDNGRGFDRNPNEDRRFRSGLGLLGMKERAEAVGGELLVESQPLSGTRVVLRVPARFREGE
ncbi:MAG: PAS domain-containing protein [Geothermobacteraceae bacterium]